MLTSGRSFRRQRRNETIAFVLGVIFDIKKRGLNEQVEIISPRIYEQASNPASCHSGGGPAGSGRELIFPVLWATAAFSNCVTEQGRCLVVVLQGEPPVGGGAPGAVVD